VQVGAGQRQGEVLRRECLCGLQARQGHPRRRRCGGRRQERPPVPSATPLRG
jgi:hypothetical protein